MNHDAMPPRDDEPRLARGAWMRDWLLRPALGAATGALGLLLIGRAFSAIGGT